MLMVYKEVNYKTRIRTAAPPPFHTANEEKVENCIFICYNVVKQARDRSVRRNAE